MPAAEAISVPRVAAGPMSARDAGLMLERLGGPVAPAAWQGGLPFPYRLGPGPAKLHLVVENDKKVRSIWNVIGKIRGREAPDEWVVLGNHRDAWVYGGVDPSTGTATLMETARAFGELARGGWRPRRTLVFGSWDGLMKLYIDPAQSKEVPALIRSPNKTRKRYPAGVVETVASEAEALERAGENLHSAIVVGPSRSSEGFLMYYLVRWL